MDFFDNVMNKTKEAFDIACKKTEEVVTVQKQKFDVATIENKRNKDFEKLGKLYFESLKDTEPENPEMKAIVLDIREKNAKINEIKKDINEAKNKRVCPKCAAFVEDNAVFCSTCGAKIEFDSEDDENE